MNRELLIYFQKAGIRLDDVQYIDLFNEYRTLSAQGEKVSYIVARLATEYAVSERKVYSLIRRFKTDCNALLFGGGCPKTYWDIKQIALVNFYLFYYSCLTLYIIETQLFCLYL